MYFAISCLRVLELIGYFKRSGFVEQLSCGEPKY